MNDIQKGVSYFIVFCFVVVIIPMLFVSYGSFTEDQYLTIIILLAFASPFILLVYNSASKFAKLYNLTSHHICFHSSVKGPEHMIIDRDSVKKAMKEVSEPYTLAYIWMMCRKYGTFKNLKLQIGNETVYVWAKFQTTYHYFYTRNGKFIHHRRLGSYRFLANDKPYRPYIFRTPFIEDEETLLAIANKVDSKLKTIDDIINL